MRGCSRLLAPRLPAVLLGAAAALSVLAASGSAAPADRVAELRQEAGSLADRERAATLELYALETRLATTRAQVAALAARREVEEGRLRSLRIQLDAAWQSVFVAEERLGLRLRQLYEAGVVDPVAVLLGAESLDHAIGGLESLRSLASSDRELVAQVRRARAELSQAKREVAARAAAIREAEEAARASAAELEAARARRAAYVQELAAQRGLNAARIARAQRTARAAASRSAPAAAPDAATSVPAAALAAPSVLEVEAADTADAGERTLTVEATAYALRGRTATGIPTAWGVVAVDPSVIPLGSRLTVPGYGEGIAADTGGAIRGAKIDVWLPTVAEALAWGRRTVTITVHGR